MNVLDKSIVSLQKPFLDTVAKNRARFQSKQKVLINTYIEVAFGLLYCLFLHLEKKELHIVNIPRKRNEDLYDIYIFNSDYIKVAKLDIKAGRVSLSFLSQGRIVDKIYLCIDNKIYNSKYDKHNKLKQMNLEVLIGKIVLLDKAGFEKICEDYISTILELLNITNDIDENFIKGDKITYAFSKIVSGLEYELNPNLK